MMMITMTCVFGSRHSKLGLFCCVRRVCVCLYVCMYDGLSELHSHTPSLMGSQIFTGLYVFVCAGVCGRVRGETRCAKLTTVGER